MPDVEACAICEGNSKWTAFSRDEFENECARCGKFEITGAAAKREKTPEVCRKLAGWVRDRNRVGNVPRITGEILAQLAMQSLPGVAERSERLLLEAVTALERLNDQVDLGEPRFVAATYSWDRDEMRVLWQLLSARGWMKTVYDRGPMVVMTAEGFMAADELSAKRGRSEEVFVAMSFSPEMTTAYERGLRVGIEHAGYVPIRVDRTEHVNRIDDEIVARIRSSAFVVADFTEQKSGVYFEAGFALGLNLPVIWTCRDYDISKLHFDVRQYNCIDWTDEADLARRLRLRIEAIVGRGPRAAYASDVRAQSAEGAST